MQKLSKRLQAIADMVPPGSRIVDIGTDHAYLPIYLVQTGICPEALAMDIHAGPLQAAQKHIRQAELENRIKTRLSDGLAALCPGEADTAVIAGMGGALMQRILSEYLSAAAVIPDKNVKENSCEKESGCQIKDWILQPQSELKNVRRFLREHGFCICDETMLSEDGKYYTILRAARTQECAGGYAGSGVSGNRDGDSDADFPLDDRLADAFGPVLLRRNDPVLAEWLQREMSLQEEILKNLEHADSAQAAARRKEVQSGRQLLAAAQRQMKEER